jgi:hypothetical protein
MNCKVAVSDASMAVPSISPSPCAACESPVKNRFVVEDRQIERFAGGER